MLVIAAGFLSLSSPIVDLAAPSLVFALGTSQKDTPEGWNSIVAAASWLSLACLLLGTIAAVGLVLLRRWARLVGTVVLPCSLLVYLPVGEVSHSGAAFSVALAAFGLWSAALCMAYFAEPSRALR